MATSSPTKTPSLPAALNRPKATLDVPLFHHHNGLMMNDQANATPLDDTLSRLCQQFGLHSLYLFGSRAEAIYAWLLHPAGPLQPSSADVDVGIRLRPAVKLDVRDKVRLTQALESLFQEQRVDLVLLDEADPFLAANIIRGRRLYALDTYVADEYELYILRRAADLAPFERARQALILGTT